MPRDDGRRAADLARHYGNKICWPPSNRRPGVPDFRKLIKESALNTLCAYVTWHEHLNRDLSTESLYRHRASVVTRRTATSHPRSLTVLAAHIHDRSLAQAPSTATVRHARRDAGDGPYHLPLAGAGIPAARRGSAAITPGY